MKVSSAPTFGGVNLVSWPPHVWLTLTKPLYVTWKVIWLSNVRDHYIIVEDFDRIVKGDLQVFPVLLFV